MFHSNVLEEVYGNGLFQILLCFCCSMTTFFNAIEFQSIIFLHFTPEFTCTDASMSEFSEFRWISSATFREVDNHTFSLTDDRNYHHRHQCWALAQKKGQQSIKLFVCSNWSFDPTVMKRTLVTDHKLICNREHIVYWLGTCFFASMSLGNIVAMFTDRFRRRRVFLFYLTWEIISTILIPFADNLPLVFFLRIIRTMTLPIILFGICILQELVPTSKRAVYGNFFWMPFSFGYCCSAGIAFFTRDWYYFRLFALIPLVFYLPVYFILPESPRWLTLHGKYWEYEQTITRIAWWNGVTVRSDYLHQAVMSIVTMESDLELVEASTGNNDQVEMVNDKCHPDSILDVFRKPNMRKRTIVLCIYITTVTMCYYGLSTGVSFASDNLYLNVLFMGLSEFPAPLFGWIWSETFNRRTSQISLMLITAACVFLSPFLKKWCTLSGTIVIMIGKLASTTIYNVGDFYLAECFPTTIRNMGVFFTLAIGCLASGLDPYINICDKIIYFLPELIYAILSSIGAMLIYKYLPETKYYPLAQTIKQSEALIKGKENEWMEMINNGL